MASSTDGTIEIAALGRPFSLGMLYDCRKDALIPAITLWDHEKLRENTIEAEKQHSEINIATSDSIADKLSSLIISGSLQLSLLAGLVNVGGSAKYFRDTKKSLKQERLTLQYKTTTRYESLTMSHLGRGQVSHPNVFEDDTATHVVTAILYGANAYFVFDRKSCESDEKKMVEGEAKILMSKLNYLTGKTGTGTSTLFNMDESEQSAVRKFCCTFYGDFKLSTNPTSFSEAVDVYRELPKMLGENGEHAVPVRVWLYPLAKLDSRAARLLREISHRLIIYSSDIIEHLQQTEMKCNDLLKDRAATTFPAIKEKLKAFTHNCHQYKVEFVQKLGSVLPSIRGGGQEESALTVILKAHEKSPYNRKSLERWLKNREEELCVLNHFLDQLQELDVKVDDHFSGLSVSAIQNVVSFVFTSLDSHDSFLDELSKFNKPAEVSGGTLMSNIVQSFHRPLNEFRNFVTNAFVRDKFSRSEINLQLKLLKEIKNLPHGNDTKFIFTSKYDNRHPGACILIYEIGCSEPAVYIPTPKPATPTISDASYDRITVELSDPDFATVEYLVEFRMINENKWTSHPVEKNKNFAVLSGLEPETKYAIRTTAVGKLGYAVSSDPVNAVTDQASIIPPTDVLATQVKADSITLTWSSPKHCKDVAQYIIEYKEENKEWQKEETNVKVNTFTLKKLKLNTTYSIRMCTVAGVEMSKYGKELHETTKKGPKDRNRFTPLSGTPAVYLLKMKSAKAGISNKKEFGEASHSKRSNKTIMLLGATGSGKSTLINGMINHILGVEWENTWRFKLIDEETNKSQAHSQTSEVIPYQIHHTDEFQVPYSLTIIDTPGFGDTRGIKQDKAITERIRELFSNENGIDAIDAVCFVVQAPLARLTHTQRYIFESILSVFGKNISNNIITLVTFCDGSYPPVLHAMKEANIPCAKEADGTPVHFRFNNSALFASNSGYNSGQEDFVTSFWNLGECSMSRFFTQLSGMETQSLRLTKEVLQERKQLEATVEGVHVLIQKRLSNMTCINATKDLLEKHKTQIKENKDFEYEIQVHESKRIDIPSGKFVTNCQGCNYTCHYPCLIKCDEEKFHCNAMKNGRCTVCPGKCEWNVHFNMTYIWDVKVVTKRETYKELKRKYEEAMGEKMNAEQIVAKLELEYQQVQGELLETMTTVAKCLQRLKEIALRPDPLSTPDYIDLLIQSEEQEAKAGFKQRIEELQKVRARAVLLQEAAEDMKNREGRSA